MKNPLLLILFICLSISSMAQQGNSLVSPFEGVSGRLRLLAPDVAKSQEYGNVPVNFSTGQLNFNMPIYQIEVDENLTIPIQLVYNNTGLKPQEVPTWVGNGWNLEVGGTIVQNINGLSDFDGAGLRNQGVHQQMQSYLKGEIVGLTRYQYLTDVLNSQKDTQYDLFSFNFLGKSGKFYFLGDSVILMNKMPIKIAYASNTFTISDEKGYQFAFTLAVANGGFFSDGYVHHITDPAFMHSVTWYLTRITSPNGVEVEFNYHKDVSYRTSVQGISYSTGFTGGDSCTYHGGFGPSLSSTEIDVTQQIVDNIKWKGKKVDFEFFDRNDLIGIHGVKAKGLSAIVVYDEANQEINRIGFGHSYIGTNDRLKLDYVSFIENKAPHSAVQTTSFEYYDKIGDDIPIPSLWILGTPRPANNAVDHWGYYNGNNGQNKIPAANYSLIISTHSTNFGTADRRAHSTYSQIGMLKKINYPTNGFTEIYYEPNVVTYNNASEIPFFLKTQTPETPPPGGVGINLQIGGNRISRIVDNTGDAESNERIITYEQPNLLAVPYYITSIESGLLSKAPIPTDPCISCGTRYIVSENNVYNWDGYHVEYRKVTETYGGNGENGKKIYEFNGNYYTSGPASEPPYAPTVNLSWRTGSLAKELTYEKNDSTYTLVNELTNTYNPIAINPITRFGFKAGRTMACAQEAFDINYHYDYFTHIPTHVFTDYYHLQSTTTTDYSDGMAISNTVDYTYTPEVLLKSTSTKNSKNKTESTTNYYANDFNNLAGTNIAQLKSRNIIGIPLKIIRSVDNKAIDGVMIKSDVNGNPLEIYRYENASFDTLTHNPAQYILPQFKLFESRKYSSKGNPIQLTRLNLPPTTYVWGYKHSYPIATLQNAHISNVEAVIGNLNTVADILLSERIDSIGRRLRDALPYAMVTSSVMKSGAGPSQITAPNGLKRTFEYDGVNRVSTIKDDAGNLTDVYKYYYHDPCITVPPTPVISVSASSSCTVTLSASGCTGGTIIWSNGFSGTSISVSTNISTSYTAKCKIRSCESLVSNAFTVPSLPSGWSTMFVGEAGWLGCVQKISGNLNLATFSPNLVSDTTDNFQWIFQPFSGDVTIIAKIASIPKRTSATSGIMIRSDLNAHDRYYALVQDGYARLAQWKRDFDGGTSIVDDTSIVNEIEPADLEHAWIKVVKTGNTIRGYFSSDIDPEANNAWTGSEASPITLDVGSNFYLGFAVWGLTNQTTFTNITINGVAF